MNYNALTSDINITKTASIFTYNDVQDIKSFKIDSEKILIFREKSGTTIEPKYNKDKSKIYNFSLDKMTLIKNKNDFTIPGITPQNTVTLVDTNDANAFIRQTILRHN